IGRAPIPSRVTNIAAWLITPCGARSLSNPGRDPTMAPEACMAQLAGNEQTLSTEYRLTGAYLVIALVALLVGVVTGLFQALSHAGVNLYPQRAPLVASYYKGLTVHGVMNALVWTTFLSVVSCSSSPRGHSAGRWRAMDWPGRRTDL